MSMKSYRETRKQKMLKDKVKTINNSHSSHGEPD